MKKEKVLIVHNYYKIPGGEDTVVNNEKEMLKENGHEVIMYTRHNDEIKSKGIFGKLLLPFETIFSFKTFREVKKIIKSENIDIVHVHNTFPLISPSVYSISKKSGAKVIQTIHNFRLLCPAATFVRDNKICEDCLKKGLITSVKHNCYRKSKLQTIITALMLKFNRMIGSYKKVDAYIALTEFNKKKLSVLIDEEKIFIKPNFMKKEQITYKGKKDEDYFLFVGRIDELKGIRLLVKAWKDIENSNLIVIGQGPLKNELDESIKNNGIDNVRLIGFKSNDEVIKFIKNAKALIVPSQWYEGFPMIIVESLSVGTPVIASDLGNLSTIIEEKKNGLLFRYDNIDDLKKKIYEVKTNELLAGELSKGAINSFKKNYNQDKNYKNLLNIYNKCSSKH